MATPAEVLTTPCVKSPVRFATAGDIVDAYAARDGDFDVCSAKVDGIRKFLGVASPTVIPAPAPARRFKFIRPRNVKKVS